MTNKANVTSSVVSSLETEIEERFGVLPNFFRHPSAAPEITENLWGFAKFGYLDNPLPPLFKERLFVYLSRFCEVRYCISRHLGFLVGLGRPSGEITCPPETVAQVLQLIRRPLPRGAEIDPYIKALQACDSTLTELPQPSSDVEEAIFACATHVFLQTPQATRCFEALQHIFEERLFQHLLMFLTFVHTAHFWTKLHPELKLEEDVEKLLAVHSALAEGVLHDPEASICKTSQELISELEMLRQERQVWQELRFKEQRFHSLVTASAQIVWTAGPDGKVIDDSPTWRAFTGQTFEEGKRSGWRKILHPDDLEHTATEWLDALTHKKLFQSEYRVRSIDGTYRWMAARAVPVLYADGSIREWVGMNTDIHEQKQAELILEKSEQRYRTLFDSMDEGFCLLDIIFDKNHQPVDFRFLEVNPSFAKQTGLNDVLDKLACELIPGIEQYWLDVFGQVAKTGEPTRFENRAKPLQRWFEVYAFRVEISEGKKVGVIFNDITSRKESEVALRESRAALDFILESAQIGDWNLDLITNTSRRSLLHDQCFGYTEAIPESEWGVTQFLQHIHPEDRLTVERTFQTALQQNSPWQVECRVIWPDKSIHWIAVHGNIYRWNGEKPARMLGTVIDISERKGTEEKITRLTAQSEQQRRLYETILSHVPDLIYVFNPDHRFIFANQALLDMWGRTWDEAIGKNCLELGYEPWHAAMHDREIEQVIATRKPIRGEVPFDGAQGRRIYDYIFVPVIGAQGEVEAVAGATRDITERTMVEEYLHDSRERLQAALDGSGAGTFRWDINNNTMESDANLDRLFGLSHEETINSLDVFTEFVHPGDQQNFIRHCQACVREGCDLDIEFRVIWPDGSIHWLDDKGKIFFNDSNKPIYMAGMCIDITERKLAQQWEANQKQVLELIARDMPLAIIFESVIRMIEAQFLKGMIASILLLDKDGQHLRQGAAPNLPEAYFQAIDGIALGPRAASCGTAAYLQEAVYAADIATDPLWVDYRELALSHNLKACWSTPIFSSAGRLLGTFSMHYHEVREPNTEDLHLVTTAVRTAAIAIERKHAVEARRESDERFRTLVDHIPQLTWSAKPGTEGEIAWFNQNWYDYTGLRPDETKGLGWQAVHHPDYAQQAIAKFAHHVKEGLDWEDTFPLRRKDGQYRWFLSRMKCVRDELGNIIRIFGSNTDITQQREMENELRQLTAHLSEVDRRKDEFLATLAHELRNPLAPIRTGLQLIQLSDEKTTSLQKTIPMMERQVTQLVRLIDDLMDVSRISRGKIDLRKEEILLSEAIHNAIETSRPLIEKMEHELVLSMPPEPIVLEADLTRLSQVFMNLLNNAAKYSDRGGRIFLAVVQRDAEVILSIKDNGIGIAADQLPRIFDMFAQVACSTDKAQGGLGIGLSLVKRLVEMHNGSVEAKSDGEGKGSEFIVRLPITKNITTTPPLSKPIDNKPQSSLKILIVDDNRDGADSLAMMLEVMGNNVGVAYDGEQGVELAEKLKPDVILLDIGLPKLNGYEACQLIRQQSWSKDLILIALTGWGQAEDRRRSQEAGFHLHLVKPLDPAALKGILASLTEARRL